MNRADRSGGAFGLRPVHLALAAAVTAACVLVGVTHLIYETDVWEHLLVGKVFWTQHRVLWGFSGLLWPFWSLGGVAGLDAWRWLTALATFALLWAAARTLGAKGLAPFFVIALGALVYRQRMQIRPETLAGVWFALSMWLLERRRQRATAVASDESATRGGVLGDLATAWPLVLLAWIWANTHISFYLGFVLLAIHFAGARNNAERTALARLALACLAISFVNPFGWRTLVRPLQFIFFWRNEPFFAAISEIRPIVWSQNWSNGLPLLLIGWPALAIARARRGHVDRVEWLMLALFTAQAFSSGRFVATYVLAAVPYVARGLEDTLGGLAHTAPLRSPWARTLLVSAACVLGSAYDWTHNVAPLGAGLDPSRMPVAACDWMEAHGVRGRGMNHFPLGGYLLWRFWPDKERLPFIDIHGHEDSPREIRDAYTRAMASPGGWRALDERWRFDWALFSRRYADQRGLLDVVDDDERWALVFVDDVAALYVRREGALAPLAERFGYRTLGGSRATIAARVEAAAHDPAIRAEMQRELARQARETAANFYGRAMARVLDASAPSR